MTAQVVACDVTNGEAVAASLDCLTTHDTVVNGAGGNRPQPFLEVDLATFDGWVALDLRGVFIVTQVAIGRLLREERPGVVINLSSHMGHVGARNRSVYCPTKPGVEGLTKALAVEFAPTIQQHRRSLDGASSLLPRRRRTDQGPLPPVGLNSPRLSAGYDAVL